MLCCTAWRHIFFDHNGASLCTTRFQPVRGYGTVVLRLATNWCALRSVYMARTAADDTKVGMRGSCSMPITLPFLGKYLLSTPHILPTEGSGVRRAGRGWLWTSHRRRAGAAGCAVRVTSLSAHTKHCSALIRYATGGAGRTTSLPRARTDKPQTNVGMSVNI